MKKKPNDGSMGIGALLIAYISFAVILGCAYMFFTSCEQTTSDHVDGIGGDDDLVGDEGCDLIEIEGSTLEFPQFVSTLPSIPSRTICGSSDIRDQDVFQFFAQTPNVLLNIEILTPGVHDVMFWRRIDIGGDPTFHLIDQFVNEGELVILDWASGEQGYFLMSYMNMSADPTEYKVNFWSTQ